nr:MAG TPA: hypothetical protein [Caudoviricetes sp.]
MSGREPFSVSGRRSVTVVCFNPQPVPSTD